MKIISEKRDIYLEAIKTLRLSNKNMLIIERTSSLLLGPRKIWYEKKYHSLLMDWIYSLPDSDRSLIYLYNVVETKNEMFERELRFEKILKVFEVLTKIKESCKDRFYINHFKEPGNAAIIGDKRFNIWIETPDGKYISLNGNNERYAKYLYNSFKHHFLKLPYLTIEELIKELRPRVARQSILD